jgi:hypothetical protein
MVADAVTGAYPPNADDPVAHLLVSYYAQARTHEKIEATDFTVELHEPRISTKDAVFRMRVNLARQFPPLEVRWIEQRGEDEVEKTKAYRVEASDIREKWNPQVVNVPIWRVIYQPGQKGAYKYVREFLATDGTVLMDEMAKCMLCNAPTIAICDSCGLTACENHINSCRTCGQFFCNNDSTNCVNCKSSFCKPHAIGQACVTCSGFVCSTDDVRCVACNGTICKEHTETCAECQRNVCEEHAVEARYFGAKKTFCSEPCHSKYGADYKQQGVLGKLGKIAARKHK